MPIYASNKEVYELAKKFFPDRTFKKLEEPGGILSRNKRTRIAGVREIRNNRDFHKVWNALLDEAKEHEDLTPKKLSALKYMVKTSERARKHLKNTGGTQKANSTPKNMQSKFSQAKLKGAEHSTDVRNLRREVRDASNRRRSAETARRNHGPRPVRSSHSVAGPAHYLLPPSPRHNRINH